MVNDDDDDEALPARLDPKWVMRQGAERLQQERREPGLFGRWMLSLRARYSTQIELAMLDDYEKVLRKRTDVMELAAKEHGVRSTLWERAETEALNARTAHVNARSAFETAQAGATTNAQVVELEAKNRLLEAQIKNQALEGKLAGKSAANKSDDRRSPEDSAYERGRQQKRTQRAEQKGALDEDLETQARLQAEFNARVQGIEQDTTLTAEQKAAAIKRLRTQYAKIFAREY